MKGTITKGLVAITFGLMLNGSVMAVQADAFTLSFENNNIGARVASNNVSFSTISNDISDEVDALTLSFENNGTMVGTDAGSVTQVSYTSSPVVFSNCSSFLTLCHDTDS